MQFATVVSLAAVLHEDINSSACRQPNAGALAQQGLEADDLAAARAPLRRTIGLEL